MINTNNRKLFLKKDAIISCPANKLNGYSLIELIVVIAGLAVLTSIASSAISNIFSDLENDEVQAHLNSLAEECLRLHASAAESNDDAAVPTFNDVLLDKNNYLKKKDSDGNLIAPQKSKCNYFQVDPKDNSSETHFSMGFGIAYGKVTKFAIADEASNLNDNIETDIEIACKSWAGEGNCLANASDYSAFFTHMDDVRKARATCNINLRANMASTPNPTDGGNQTTWDSEADKDCKDKTLPANASSYSTTNCKTNGCTKDVKIKGGKIVGYSDSDYNQAQTLECSNSISTYINSNSYNGGAETKTDLTGCTGTKYICDYNEHSEASYENCKIEDAISACKRDLENKRLTETGLITVSGAGLPPCGQKYWVCNSTKVIYETEISYNTNCPGGT